MAKTHLLSIADIRLIVSAYTQASCTSNDVWVYIHNVKYNKTASETNNLFMHLAVCNLRLLLLLNRGLNHRIYEYNYYKDKDYKYPHIICYDLFKIIYYWNINISTYIHPDPETIIVYGNIKTVLVSMKDNNLSGSLLGMSLKSSCASIPNQNVSCRIVSPGPRGEGQYQRAPRSFS